MEERASFSISITDHRWILDNPDDPHDLCSHGTVSVRLGSRVLAEDECTTSAGGLKLLRSLTEDHPLGECNGQIIPHCGHGMYLQEGSRDVLLLGCNAGIDFGVHHDGDVVVLEMENGERIVLDRGEYEWAVLEFVDAVERFYARCSSKKLPDDKVDRQGYKAFWKEWKRRKREICKRRPARDVFIETPAE